MNVIISQDKSVRFTQESNSAYNIQDIIFYISKAIEVESIQLQLKKVRSIYPFELIHNDTAINYNIYRVIFTQAVELSEREYDLVLIINDEELELGSKLIASIRIAVPARARYTMRNTIEATSGPYGLTDQHEPIEIVDRKIVVTNNQNVLVAEDNISQAITFRIPRMYDGIDLRSKDLYFDYVKKVDGVEKLFNIPLSNYGGVEGADYITVIQDEKDSSIEYLMVPFAVPYEITQEAGTIKFAISAVDLSTTTDSIRGTVRQYVWQTLPATLTIQPNLFKRNAAPINGEEASGSELLIEAIEALELTTEELTDNMSSAIDEIEEIKSSDIYALDATGDDGEVIFSAGGADIE